MAATPARRWRPRSAARSRPTAAPTRRPIGYAVYTNMVPGGGFRGYGASQTTFAIECAIDELARLLGMSPFEIRRKNMVRPSDWIESIWKDPSDVELRQLRARPVPRPRREGAGERAAASPKPEGDDWAGGHRHRAGHAGLRPADRASLGRRDDAAARRQLPPCGRLDRDGQRLGHLAQADRRLGPRHAGGQHRHHQRRHRSARPTTPAPSPAPAPWSPARR